MKDVTFTENEAVFGNAAYVLCADLVLDGELTAGKGQDLYVYYDECHEDGELYDEATDTCTPTGEIEIYTLGGNVTIKSGFSTETGIDVTLEKRIWQADSEVFDDVIALYRATAEELGVTMPEGIGTTDEFWDWMREALRRSRAGPMTVFMSLRTNSSASLTARTRTSLRLTYTPACSPPGRPIPTGNTLFPVPSGAPIPTTASTRRTARSLS